MVLDGGPGHTDNRHKTQGAYSRRLKAVRRGDGGQAHGGHGVYGWQRQGVKRQEDRRACGGREARRGAQGRSAVHLEYGAELPTHAPRSDHLRHSSSSINIASSAIDSGPCSGKGNSGPAFQHSGAMNMRLPAMPKSSNDFSRSSRASEEQHEVRGASWRRPSVGLSAMRPCGLRTFVPSCLRLILGPWNSRPWRAWRAHCLVFGD